ncbi:helix-turn-helix domain-containing protein [Croceivirga thetidis]|uniref:AraC family transcriptional regulator n=1 Tax=Croceivirga thetidis TaxID=2721623 RepID=A0ABX1GL34_9FLAO|nr:helix-turn-helix domain-containing protein [Croceivirga thetidis]NKI30571.1 AraC family transcriptional regulator [Croceivirga thetidis]
MSVNELFNLLLLIGAVHGFIFIGVTFFLRKRIERPVLFLNLFVLFLSLNNLQSWALEAKFSADVLTPFLTIPWYLMIVPMFYSFLLHYLELEKKKNPLIGISSGLFLIAVFIRVWLLVRVQKGTLSIQSLENYNLIEDSFALVYSIGLFVMCIDVLRRHQKLFASILVFDNLRWIRIFLRWGAAIFVLWAIAVLLNIFSEDIKAPESYYPLRLVSSILIYWVAYQAFFQYRLLKDRIKLRAVLSGQKPGITINVEGGNSPKTSKSKLSFNQFEIHIREHQSFLNPNLSLELVAEELGVGVSTLSKVVNESGHGFTDHINNARVAAAKEFLTNSAFQDYTIVAIGLECGFNSKSAFYNAFKKIAKESPSEFRRRHSS